MKFLRLFATAALLSQFILPARSADGSSGDYRHVACLLLGTQQANVENRIAGMKLLAVLPASEVVPLGVREILGTFSREIVLTAEQLKRMEGDSGDSSFQEKLAHCLLKSQVAASAPDSIAALLDLHEATDVADLSAQDRAFFEAGYLGALVRSATFLKAASETLRHAGSPVGGSLFDLEVERIRDVAVGFASSIDAHSTDDSVLSGQFRATDHLFHTTFGSRLFAYSQDTIKTAQPDGRPNAAEPPREFGRQ